MRQLVTAAPTIISAAIALLLAVPPTLTPAAQIAPLHLAQADSTDLEHQGLDQLEAGDFAGAIATYEQLLDQTEAAEDPDNYYDAVVGLAKARTQGKFDDKEVANFPALVGLVKEHQPGDTVTLKVKRDDKVITLKMTIGKRGGPS